MGALQCFSSLGLVSEGDLCVNCSHAASSFSSHLVSAYYVPGMFPGKFISIVVVVCP